MHGRMATQPALQPLHFVELAQPDLRQAQKISDSRAAAESRQRQRNVSRLDGHGACMYTKSPVSSVGCTT